jgi:hypothetical protein
MDYDWQNFAIDAPIIAHVFLGLRGNLRDMRGDMLRKKLDYFEIFFACGEVSAPLAFRISKHAA